MKKSTAHSELVFGMNDRLFGNALEGVTDAQAKERLSGHNNPLIWIATHTLFARYNTLNLLGGNVKNPYDEQFGNFRAYDANDSFPSLDALKTEWKTVSAQVKDAFAAVSEEHLAAAAPVQTPIGDASIGGFIAFLAAHESYDIGQMAFLKKYYSGEAMKYS